MKFGEVEKLGKKEMFIRHTGVPKVTYSCDALYLSRTLFDHIFVPFFNVFYASIFLHIRLYFLFLPYHTIFSRK
jgi:hypothetical protein